MTLQERTCQLRLAIEIISDKWRIAVLHQLSGGPRRTSQLQKALEEIAPKVLTQTLRGLERDGLVLRKAYAVTPPRVDYRLTETAQPLLTALDELCRWADAYGRQTLLARSNYDAQMDARANLGRAALPARPGSGSGQISTFLQTRFGIRKMEAAPGIERPIPLRHTDGRMRQVTSVCR
jgi:DNA-binding HxlR family transcriptional regulator